MSGKRIDVTKSSVVDGCVDNVLHGKLACGHFYQLYFVGVDANSDAELRASEHDFFVLQRNFCKSLAPNDAIGFDSFGILNLGRLIAELFHAFADRFDADGFAAVVKNEGRFSRKNIRATISSERRGRNESDNEHQKGSQGKSPSSHGVFLLSAIKATRNSSN